MYYPLLERFDGKEQRLKAESGRKVDIMNYAFMELEGDIRQVREAFGRFLATASTLTPDSIVSNLLAFNLFNLQNGHIFDNEILEIYKALVKKSDPGNKFELINAIREIDGSKGYAIGFEGLIQYISDNLPTNEQIGKVFRQDIPMYPSLAIREFVANALIHQDFLLGGSAPMIEVFRNRMEIMNPGKPLIDTMRFIDHAPLSRNELLASTMRRMGFCEERGSGVDRALAQCEIHQLPAPIFLKEELFTKVTMFAPMTLRQMNAEDKIRACYQHCCLQYVAGKKMTNETFRDRLGIAAQNYSIASRIIADAIDAKLVKPQSEGQSKKYAQYIPIWA